VSQENALNRPVCWRRAGFKLPERNPEAEFGEAAEVVTAGVSAKFRTNAYVALEPVIQAATEVHP